MEMKFKVALVTVIVAGLTASLAVAAPATSPKNPAGTDTTATTTTTTGNTKQRTCRPRFAQILRGTLASVADDQLSFTITVRHSNKHARLYRGQAITVQVDANTRIWRLGQKVTLGELTVGDHLVVQTRACKKGTDLTAPLLAARVTARPAKPAPTTTTTTTTTT